MQQIACQASAWRSRVDQFDSYVPYGFAPAVNIYLANEGLSTAQWLVGPTSLSVSQVSRRRPYRTSRQVNSNYWRGTFRS